MCFCFLFSWGGVGRVWLSWGEFGRLGSWKKSSFVGFVAAVAT